MAEINYTSTKGGMSRALAIALHYKLTLDGDYEAATIMLRGLRQGMLRLNLGDACMRAETAARELGLPLRIDYVSGWLYANLQQI